MSERNEDSAEYRAAWQQTRDAIMAELVCGDVPSGGVASGWLAEKYKHASDCALHSEPAMKSGPCDCGSD